MKKNPTVALTLFFLLVVKTLIMGGAKTLCKNK
jgi:hypothetical protein